MSLLEEETCYRVWERVQEMAMNASITWMLVLLAQSASLRGKVKGSKDVLQS